jgi:hypothetical protein
MCPSIEVPLNLHGCQEDEKSAAGERCQQQHAFPKHPHETLFHPIDAWHITAQISLIDHVTQGVQPQGVCLF